MPSAYSFIRILATLWLYGSWIILSNAFNRPSYIANEQMLSYRQYNTIIAQENAIKRNPYQSTTLYRPRPSADFSSTASRMQRLQSSVQSEMNPSSKEVLAADSSTDIETVQLIPVSSSGSSGKTLIFLPGLDGIGDYSIPTISKLSSEYDIWKLEISGNDRSTFMSLSDLMVSKIESFDGPVTLMGESFGGLLACHVATRVSDKISQLVLANPATSYGQSQWPVTGPIITRTGPLFPVVGLTALGVTGVEPNQVIRYGSRVIGRISSIGSAFEEVSTVVTSGIKLVNLLSLETVQHRLRYWLEEGINQVNSKYKDIVCPTLILVGVNDRLLPSLAEGRRLRQEIGSTLIELIEYPDAGHALLDDSFNIVQLFKENKVFKENFSIYDNIYPSEKDLSEVRQNLNRFRSIVSPVFISRNPDGSLRRGIASIPTGKSGRPVLMVGNHQLLGLDMGFIVNEFIEKKQCLIRGLAHPVIFSGNTSGESSMRNLYVKFGAVPVSPTSYYELLKRNETILLFPGGAKEALHKKGEEYKLFWPEKVDFIKMATLMDAIVVPFAAIGVSDSVNFILDGEELANAPVIGERLRKASMNIPQARPDVNESLIGPLLAPKTPSRFYFLFQKPIDTRTLKKASKAEFKATYEKIRKDVEDGLEVLQEIRDQDPFKDTVKRLLYENLSKDQAPTADIYNRRWIK